MTDSSIEQPHFIRQRRNLILTSLVLLLAQYTNATMTKINVFGNLLELNKVIVVSYILWVPWAYFLLRYYQYLRQFLHLDINESFKKQRLVYAMKALQKKLNKDHSLLDTVHPDNIKNLSFIIVTKLIHHSSSFMTMNVSGYCPKVS